MSYYVCQAHRKAWSTKRQFIGHQQGAHQGQPRPPDEAIMMEEVPEGYEVAETKGKTAPPPGGGGPGGGRGAQLVYGTSLGPHQILEGILQEHPGLPEAAVKEVMTWTKYKDFLHPNEVSWLLQQMSDVPKGAPVLIQTKYALALSNTQAASAGGVIPGAFGGPGPGGVSLGFPGGIGAPGLNLSGPQQPTSESPATVELRQQVATIRQDMAQLLDHLDEKDRREAEEKREAEHRAELKAIQDDQAKALARVDASNKEAIERLEKQHKEAMESLRDMMKGKGETPEAATLRTEVASLRVQVHKAEREGLEKEATDLRARLAEAEKREPASPSEMGLIQHTADKVVDAAREAGEGLKTLIIGAQKGQSLFPGRRTPTEREAVGKNLLAKVQKDQALLQEMDGLFSPGVDA